MADTDTHFMQLALDLAQQGFPLTYPNPLVGAVLVINDNIIGSGFHRVAGGAHAEVEALDDARTRGASNTDIANATLYVTLEPCSHHGKTPPCTDAIIQAGIKKVVVGSKDPNPKVNGQGIIKLQNAGVSIVSSTLEAQARELNKRFFTFHEQQRPYVILKWAQTADGFMARADYSSKWISNEASRHLTHEWRSQEVAIMIGTNTAVHDNPKLTSRIPNGRNPVRILLDRTQRVPTSFHMFDESAPVILYNDLEEFTKDQLALVKIDFSQNVIPIIMRDLYERGIQSILVEGGAQLLSSFIDSHIWDEARVFSSTGLFQEGIKAPLLSGEKMVLTNDFNKINLGADRLEVFRNLN